MKSLIVFRDTIHRHWISENSLKKSAYFEFTLKVGYTPEINLSDEKQLRTQLKSRRVQNEG